MNPRLFHILAAVAAIGFVLVFLLWPILWVPNRLAMLLAPLALIPAVIALPGLIRGKVYTHAWTTLLSTLYVAWCAMEAYANPPVRSPALTAGLLAALWFVSSNLYVRGRRGAPND